ncbi:endonuclease MutS2 [Thermoactinomyces sp. DSM 45892]|uniref:endonuclease MutS2 n=1 Tax=Thermoactinomyces sp. DSM 45892 TaxID=1882753 RepID=UPI00089BC066|nr:endonuclease MutS2 [Thermoactinomyces sp. DSM 45892]SDZ17625.1 DNA mismatch repair protein MutS2 [Thermoactinomyces sp. DSM 45892]
MSDWTQKTLEFMEVKEMIKYYSSSNLGKSLIDETEPSDDWQEVSERLHITSEGIELLRLKGDVTLGGIRDIRSCVRRAEIGGLLNEAELLDIGSTIHAGRKIKAMLRQLDEEIAPLSRLRGLTEQIESLEHIDTEIANSIDEQGFVRDSASSELRRLRQAIGTIRSRIQSTLQNLLRNANTQKMLQESIITQRYDRYVIPVKAEYRGSFHGIVHDQSSSGATLFIEPEAVVQLNNQLREQELAEQREVEKILYQLTQMIAESVEPLRINLDILAQLDFTVAKAQFARAVKAVVPKLSPDRTLVLKKARHPLIAKDTVVPIDVEMGQVHQAVIITGPNTGGKTVSLKTIGLFALMTQSGFPILAEEESQMPVYSGVFADIGDEQSIEQSLSTFSSHMTNIIRILGKIDHESLVLFDELGAGTDPTEGAALAISILEHCIGLGAAVVATTHYSELKLFAHTHPRTVNASVEFDVETLRPTYRLLIGVPGKSNAFAISKRLGLPNYLIEEAKSHISSDDNRLEEMITTLTSERKAAEDARKDADRLRAEAEEIHQGLEAKLQAWEEEKAQIREKARLEARQIISHAEREADEVLKKLREWAKARPQELKEHELIETRKRLGAAVPDLVLHHSTTTKKSDEKLAVGDEVFVASLGQKGAIVEVLSDKEFQVQIGALKMKLKRDQLEKRESKQQSQPKSTSSISRKADVRPELDLRGHLVEEAIMEIDRYLDHAILAGYKQVHLIHGKGTGALRTGVQQFLRSHRNVKSFRLGSMGEGGSGVTVVEIQ